MTLLVLLLMALLLALAAQKYGVDTRRSGEWRWENGDDTSLSMRPSRRC
jgi:hypothetical protein